MPGSHRRFCSSFVSRRKYGRQMSLCSVMPRPAALTSARCSSSAITTLKRKSATPPPPNSSGTSMPRNPLAPAAVNSRTVDDSRTTPSARGAAPSPGRRTWRRQCGTARACRRTSRAARNGHYDAPRSRPGASRRPSDLYDSRRVGHTLVVRGIHRASLRRRIPQPRSGLAAAGAEDRRVGRRPAAQADRARRAPRG